MSVYRFHTSNGASADRRDSRARPGRRRGFLAAWAERARRRREMAEVMAMPEHLLKDIGISYEDAYREYRKAFWRR